MAKYSRKKKQNSGLVTRETGLISQATSDERQDTNYAHGLFSGWPMILGWAAMLVFTFHACTHMVAAGDTWVAMACGRHFVNHGVDTIEPFSANSHKAGPTPETMTKFASSLYNEIAEMERQGKGHGAKYSLMRWWADKCNDFENWPKWKQSFTKWIHPTGWINQNWLTHVIFYKLVPKSSYEDGVSFTSNALVYWKFTIYILAMICVYFTSRIIGADRYVAVVFSCFALFIGRSFLDIRPAGFSNLLVAVFLLILALSMYKKYLYIWLIVPLVIFWCNVHGGYIYVFIMMIPFIGLHLFTCLNKKWTAIIYNLTAWPFLLFVIYKAGPTLAVLLFTILVIVLDFVLIFFKDRMVSLDFKGVYHSIGAFVAAFFASILFNPFHLTNLTHTFVISVSKNAERWRDIHEWHPAFDWANPVGTAVPFLVMYIIIWLAFLAWSFSIIYTSFSNDQSSKRKRKESGGFEWPKVNVVMIIIAALSIYMAIRSRRFIPIAGIVGCPILAMLVTQLIRFSTAKYNEYMGNGFVIPAMPKHLEKGLIAFGAIAVLYFGTWWGLKYKLVYLDPWPNDTVFTSVFMRMTASDAKPFYAMKFIKDNKLHGKMFNYWTEGGFVAFGQEPDPNNGKTPLQLFMDGRAQAAYDRTTFDEWSYILAGGRVTMEILQAAKARGDSITARDLEPIGKFMDEQLTSRDVWCILMPSNIFNDPDRTSSYYTFKALEIHPSWRLVFVNDRQKLLVSLNTAQGLKLYEGILENENGTIYPDEYHTNLNRAHKLLDVQYGQDPTEKLHGMVYAQKAFELNPTPAAMMEIIVNAAQYTNLRPEIEKICKNFADSFNEKFEEWKKIDGYRLKVESARLANFYLAQLEGSRNNTELKNKYDTQRDFCVSELRRIGMEKRW
ncbi:MAG: O-antigen ligase family protein [Sedimentisphaerales bacterium]|nr:O-antigen ligase family protein [Sedimentisphaerales bacterium]